MKFLLALLLLATFDPEHERYLEKRFAEEHGIRIILDGDDVINYFNRLDMELVRLEKAFPVLDKFDFRMDIIDEASFTCRLMNGQEVTAQGTYHPNSRYMKLAIALPLATEKISLGGYGSYSNDFCSMFRHELGHFIWFQWIDAKQQEEFGKIYGQLKEDRISISEHASLDSCELFAECFSIYTHPHYQREILPFKVERFIEGVLEAKSQEKWRSQSSR